MGASAQHTTTGVLVVLLLRCLAPCAWMLMLGRWVRGWVRGCCFCRLSRIVGSSQQSGNFPLCCCCNAAGFDRSTQNILPGTDPRANKNNDNNNNSNSNNASRNSVPMTLMGRASTRTKRTKVRNIPAIRGWLWVGPCVLCAVECRCLERRIRSRLCLGWRMRERARSGQIRAAQSFINIHPVSFFPDSRRTARRPCLASRLDSWRARVWDVEICRRRVSHLSLGTSWRSRLASTESTQLTAPSWRFAGPCW